MTTQQNPPEEKKSQVPEAQAAFAKLVKKFHITGFKNGLAETVAEVISYASDEIVFEDPTT